MYHSKISHLEKTSVGTCKIYEKSIFKVLHKCDLKYYAFSLTKPIFEMKWSYIHII